MIVDEIMPEIKSSLNLLENAVPSLYLSKDNKNIMRLPEYYTKTELAPGVNFIVDVNCVKIEKESEEDLNKTDGADSIFNNPIDVSKIPIKNISFKEEPQEEKTFELIEEDVPKESKQPTKSKNQPSRIPLSFQETQNSSDDLAKKKFRCVDCNETFAWSTELKKHKRVTHGTYVCNICLKHAVKLSSLKSHKKTKHNISYVFTCEDCDEAFFRNKELLKHMKTHKKVPTDKCTKCKKKFESDAEFSSHECIIGKKLFQCEACKRCFAGEANLNTHKKKYHIKSNKDKEDKKYECDICKKAFKKTYRLAQHKRLHDKPYQCDTCKKGFSEKAQLKAHQLNHAAVECIHLGRMKY